jgi:hypothetical protein
VEWYDHAYHIHHIGYGAIANLRKSWLVANAGFRAETKAVNIIPPGCVIQFIGRGTFTDDVRTLRKATVKAFVYQSCLVVDVNDGRLVTKVEECYSFLHDEGVEVDKYHEAKKMEV